PPNVDRPMFAPARSTVALSSTDGPIRDGVPVRDYGAIARWNVHSDPQSFVEEWLREFSDSALALLRGDQTNGSILHDILPSFLESFVESIRTVPSLRTEFQTWHDQSQKLLRLANLHCDDVNPIVRSIELAQSRVQNLIDAVEGLQRMGENSVLSVYQ